MDSESYLVRTDEDHATMAMHWNAERHWIVDGELYVAHRLMYHYALLVSPNHWGPEQRYCYKDLALMTTAMNEFVETGKLRYWHKDHTNNVVISDGVAYQDNDHGEQLYTVDW